jgi:nicotinate phosphoribosyltransferase
MAHSFVQVHGDELIAFEHFARSRPEGVVLLIDTYDTEAGARKVVQLAPKLKTDGINIRGVRIDSGDLGAMAKKVRGILDAGGLSDVIIVASGGINEDVLQAMTASKAPIDGYGIGVNLDASIDAPSLDCAYKLQEYGGEARRKLSEGKATWPGSKQVWRGYGADGRMGGDILSLESDTQTGEKLIVPVMRKGKRIAAAPSLGEIRERATRELARLPDALRRLEKAEDYTVKVSDKLKALAAQVDKTTRG